jgi:hypothetical protein
MHHATLRAAVSKYTPLVEDGKSPEEVKQAIASDEKGFDEKEVEEIYEAIVNPNPPEQNNGGAQGDSKKKGKYVVTLEDGFRDVNNFNLHHKKGADVSHFDQGRLDDLVARGYVEKQ